MKKILNYFGADGLLHIVLSATLTALLSHLFPVWIAATITLGIGIGKELLWDYTLQRGTPEGKDLIADLIGIAIGAL